jgi:hypothetical protein
MRQALNRLIENRARLIRFLVGAQMAFFFGSWLEHLSQTHAIFFQLRPYPYLGLSLICVLGFLFSGLFAFGRFTKMSAVALILSSQIIFLIYFWFKETQWFLIGILVIHLLYGSKEGRFSTLFWRTPFFLAVYLGFTISGLSKLFYPGWWNGEVIFAVLTNHPVGPGWPVEFVELLPLRFIAYFTLAAETLSFPLALWPRTRRFAWWLNTLLHFGILSWWRIGPVALSTLTVQILLYPGRDRDLLAKPEFK